MRTVLSSRFIVPFAILVVSMFFTSQTDASDAAWVIDVTEVAQDSLFGMCEDNDVLYFIGISVEQERRLCAVPLDTRELLWAIDLDPADRYMPVIDGDGNIRISSNVNQQAYIITPAGTIIDTLAVTVGNPPGERIVTDGTVMWSGIENGYTHGVNGIGDGGMIFEFGAGTLDAYDIFGSLQWQSATGGGSLHCDYVTVDRNGTSYAISANSSATSNIIATTSLGDGLWMIDNQEPFPCNFISAPVIGSDGTLYYGEFPNTIKRVSAESVPGDPAYWHFMVPQVLNEYTGDPDLWGMPVDAHDLPHSNPLMIAQDSLLVWSGKGYIEAFAIPSEGYQEDAFWPCFGHDNRRSFTTTVMYHQVTGTVFWNGEPMAEATVRISGTDEVTNTSATGEFSFLLPTGTYTLTVDGTDAVEKVAVEGATVSGVKIIGTDTYDLLWQSDVSKTGYPGIVPRSLTLDHMGNIIVGLRYYYSGNSQVGVLLSLASDGSLNWSNDGPVFSSPVVAADNSIILCQSQDDPIAWTYAEIYRYQNTGTVEYLPGGATTYPAAIGSDDVVYVHNPDTGIVGYDQSGANVWQSETNVAGAPVIDQYGTMYVASGTDLLAFNSDSTLKWTYTDASILYEPVLDGNEVYVVCNDMTIHAVRYDGTLRRIYSPGKSITATPAIDDDGTLYICTDDGMFSALNYDGTVKWQTQLAEATGTTPIITDDGTIFVAGETTIYALTVEGVIEWQYENLPLTPSIHTLNHTIYLALDDSGVLYCLSSGLDSLYAFQTPSSGVKTTAPWPCYRGNNQRTGRITDDTVVTTEEPVKQAFSLASNYPNPFNPSTTISFTLPTQGRAHLTVYSATGQKVATLVDDVLAAGAHHAVFDGTGLASGIYFYRLDAGEVTGTGKMLLVK